MEIQNSIQNLTCKYCSKTFSTTYNLKKHVTSAKICISNRPKIEEAIPEGHQFSCDYCGKIIVKHHLNVHIRTCKQHKIQVDQSEKEEIIEKYNKKIKKCVEKCDKKIEKCDKKLNKSNKKIETLKDELEKEKDTVLELELIVEKANERIRELELSQAKNEGKIEVLEKTRTKRITNNYINPKLAKINTEGLPFLTPEYIEGLIDGYTYEHFFQGPTGIARFIKECVVFPPLEGPSDSGEENPIRTIYPCTDISRHKYYKHDDSGWKLDVGAPFLNKALDALEDTALRYQKRLNDRWLNEPDDSAKKVLEERWFDVIVPMTEGMKMKSGIKRDKLISDVRQHLKDHVSI